MEHISSVSCWYLVVRTTGVAVLQLLLHSCSSGWVNGRWAATAAGAADAGTAAAGASAVGAPAGTSGCGGAAVGVAVALLTVMLHTFDRQGNTPHKIHSQFPQYCSTYATQHRGQLAVGA
jgi:hypothetical protein